MRTNIHNLFILLLSLCAGCTKFVQIDPPTTSLVTASVFNNAPSATAALTGTYSNMVTNWESYNMAIDCGMLSDELTNYTQSIQYTQFYLNAMTAAEGP